MTDVVAHLMDAQAHNAAQGRALFNPAPEINSALEHAIFLRRTATPEQAPHADALVAHLRDVFQLNELERAAERAAAGVADPIRSVHEFAKLARPLLADLLHPFLGPAKTAERLGELHRLFERTVPRTRTAVSTRQLLGVRKFTRLIEELAAWVELQAVASEHVL